MRVEFSSVPGPQAKSQSDLVPEEYDAEQVIIEFHLAKPDEEWKGGDCFTLVHEIRLCCERGTLDWAVENTENTLSTTMLSVMTEVNDRKSVWHKARKAAGDAKGKPVADEIVEEETDEDYDDEETTLTQEDLQRMRREDWEAIASLFRELSHHRATTPGILAQHLEIQRKKQEASNG